MPHLPSSKLLAPCLNGSRLTLGGRFGLAGGAPKAKEFGRGLILGASPLTWELFNEPLKPGFFVVGGLGWRLELEPVRRDLLAAPVSVCSDPSFSLLKRLWAVLKLETGFGVMLGEGLFGVSGLEPVDSSCCCRNFPMLLMGFGATPANLGGVEFVFIGVLSTLSSFTQLGFELATTEGFGKRGLGSESTEETGVLEKGVFCVGLFISAEFESGGFPNVCLKPVKGLVVGEVSSWELENLLGVILGLLASCASESFVLCAVFLRKAGLVEPAFEGVSKSDFFSPTGPEEGVDCRGGLLFPAEVEDVSSKLAPA